MNLTDLYYFSLLAAAALALFRWRTGLYTVVLFDALRDPVRKLDQTESVIITLAPAGLWAAAAAGLWINDRRQAFRPFRDSPALQRAAAFLAAALLPGAAVSAVSPTKGPLLAAFGICAYLSPLLGVVVGYAFARDPRDFRRLMAWYCVVHGVTLIGMPLEMAGAALPGLGGLEGIQWRWYTDEGVLNLHAGFHRSPDVGGLRAAHVAMFAGFLAITGGRIERLGWVGGAAWAGYCLILSARRKMIATPVVFAGAFAVQALSRRGLRKSAVALGAGVTSILVVLGLYAEAFGIDRTRVHFSTTAGTGATDRFSSEIFDRGEEAFRRGGFFGLGLGSQTQGARYIAKRPGYQIESGVGRAIAEFGVPGLMLLAAAGMNFVAALASARRRTRPAFAAWSAGFLSILVACGANMVVSHQTFSGDPLEIVFLAALAAFVLVCAPPDRPPTAPRRGTAIPGGSPGPGAVGGPYEASVT